MGAPVDKPSTCDAKSSMAASTSVYSVAVSHVVTPGIPFIMLYLVPAERLQTPSHGMQSGYCIPWARGYDMFIVLKSLAVLVTQLRRWFQISMTWKFMVALEPCHRKLETNLAGQSHLLLVVLCCRSRRLLPLYFLITCTPWVSFVFAIMKQNSLKPVSYYPCYFAVVPTILFTQLLLLAILLLPQTLVEPATKHIPTVFWHGRENILGPSLLGCQSKCWLHFLFLVPND